MKKSFHLNIAVVVAHYSQDGDVGYDLLLLVRNLSSICREVIFVSTNINIGSRNKIASYAKVICRENFGYDFYSYKVGINELEDKNGLDGILILNSSMIVLDCENLVGNFFSDKFMHNNSLSGLTISMEKSMHIQSYWVLFNGNTLINSSAFNMWWDGIIPIVSQREVIDRYEIGMSKFFKSIGVDLHALYKPSLEDKILASCRVISNRYVNLQEDSFAADAVKFKLSTDSASKINPTSILWDKIVEKYNFIKVKMLTQDNPDFSFFTFKKYLLSHPDLFELAKVAFKSRNIDMKL